ncbi:MAG TPA: hypothetical protein VFX25_18465 [Streptosporangiaceae bacterium]|nr:hypothetical protein [Streptosporangiaceae bacterium]HEX5290849.1 hypothetical protein [Streptosporangiaceae bacterium]
MTPPADSPLAASLAADPYTALAVHYGMLLGVSDFQVLAGNPRGKLQLHQAWQHGKGVVWGYGVVVDSDAGQLRVRPGLAVDGLGREVASSADMCLDVHEWLADQMNSHGFTPDGGPARYSFSAQLVLTHAACLSRPVPSVSATCGPATDAVAYSRVIEIAHLDLRPYQRTEGICARAAGTWRPPDDDRDQSFAALRALVRDGTLPAGLPYPPAGWLAAFRAVAAGAAAGMGPPGLVPLPSERTRLYPEDEPGEILLADLPDIVLAKADDGTWRLTAQPDLSVRRTHLPTWVIEELIGELLAGRVGRAPAPDAGGPRVTRIRRRDNQVRIEFDQDVVEGTVPRALEVRSFDRTASEQGWSDPLPVETTVTPVRPGTPSAPATVTFELPAPPTEDLSYRLVLRGTGPTPLLGIVRRADAPNVGQPVPLAGRAGDPPGSAADGRDVAEMLTLGATP